MLQLRGWRAALATMAIVWHPLHTSLTEITYSATDHRAHIIVKLFADDFANAVARRTSSQMTATGPLPDASMLAYVRSYFIVTDKANHAIPLEWGGSRRAGDLIWVTLTVPTPGLSGVHVQNRLMMDMFPDQANIVQAVYDGQRQSLLFTGGDGPKALP